MEVIIESQLAAVIIGGLVAAFSVFISTRLTEYLREKRESKRLAFGFKGEICAIAHMARKRKYSEEFRNMITGMEKTGQPNPCLVLAQQNYINFYNANVGKLGLLEPPLPEIIPRFYVQVNALLDDFRAGVEGYRDNLEVEELKSLYEEIAELLEDTLSLADTIESQINKYYPK